LKAEDDDEEEVYSRGKFPKPNPKLKDLLNRVILNFQCVWRHRSELGFVPFKETLPYRRESPNWVAQSWQNEKAVA
jgi:hypothetical protein